MQHKCLNDCSVCAVCGVITITSSSIHFHQLSNHTVRIYVDHKNLEGKGNLHKYKHEYERHGLVWRVQNSLAF